jgi:hypothetical protein
MATILASGRHRIVISYLSSVEMVVEDWGVEVG